MKKESFSLFDIYKPKFKDDDIKINNIHYEEICGKMSEKLIVDDNGKVSYRKE